MQAAHVVLDVAGGRARARQPGLAVGAGSQMFVHWNSGRDAEVDDEDADQRDAGDGGDRR